MFILAILTHAFCINSDPLSVWCWFSSYSHTYDYCCVITMLFMYMSAITWLQFNSYMLELIVFLADLNSHSYWIMNDWPRPDIYIGPGILLVFFLWHGPIFCWVSFYMGSVLTLFNFWSIYIKALALLYFTCLWYCPCFRHGD